MHFENVYGFAPDMVVNTGFSNGDDRYILTDTADGSNLLDIHGEIDVDGSGKDWEYTDGYAYRLPGASANGGVFDISEWFHGGVNSLETGDDVEEAAPCCFVDHPLASTFPNRPPWLCWPWADWSLCVVAANSGFSLN